MKNKKRFLSILILAIVLTLSVTIVACKKKPADGLCIYNADGELAFDKDHSAIDVEYGTVYAFPLNAAVNGEKVTATLALYDAADNELKLAYGSYTFRAVGAYRAVYTANDKTLTVNVNCRDTIAPVINVVSYALYGVEGETVPLPTCTFSDLAGIDDTSISYTVTDPDGAAVTVTDGKFTLTKIGKYLTKVFVRDNNGVSAEQVLTTECSKKYIDSDRADHVIYSFDKQDYLDLVMNVRTEDNITRQIVTSGYPAITGETDGNGVLKITSDKVYGDVHTKFRLHEDLLASQGRNIIIRFAVDKDTDYVKLYRSASEMTDKGTVGQMFGLKAGQWHEMTVCPISFGYNLNFKDFVISYRDVGGVTMYIDSITFDGEPYIPPRYKSSGKTVLADFSSEKYSVNLYQNLYSQPTTTMGRVDGTKFELLPEGDAKIPAPNKANTGAPNDGARGGVLHGTITALYGGLTYMFPEPLDLDQVNSLAVHMYAASEHSAVVFGFFDGSGFDSAVQRWYDAGKQLLFTPDQWREYVFSNEMLRRICGDGKVTGMYFYCYLKGDASAYPDYKPGTEYTCDFYLDEITVRYKENPSEQQDGTIATFENGRLTNVRDNWVMDNTANFAIKNDGFGTNQTKVLSVTSNNSGDGFIYLFDETVELKESQFLQIDLGLDADAFVTVDVGIVYAKDLVKSVVGLEPAKYASDMQKVVISYEQVRDVTADAKVQGIHVSTTAARGSKLYVDNICVRSYDENKDIDLPTVIEVADAKVCLPLNTALDLSSLQVTVTDPSDPAPTYKVISVTDPSGATVSVTDNKFIPAKAGDYTVTVRGIDAAENESENKVSGKLHVELFDLNVPKEKKAYYKEQLKFELPSSTMLVSASGLGSARLVDDSNATGGRALEVVFGSFLDNAVTIDLGDVCTVGDLKAIKVNYRVIKQKSTDVLYLNDYTEQNLNPDNPEDNVSHIGWFDYTKITYDRQHDNTGDPYMYSTQKENFTDRKIPLSAVLKELHICSSNVNGDPTGKVLIDYIELIYDDEVAPTVTVPDGTQKIGAQNDGFVDLNRLHVTVTDDIDMQPGWEVVSLKKGNEEVAVTADKKFAAPTVKTTYTLQLQGVDTAGNRSQEKTVTFDVQPYMREVKLTAADILNLISAEQKTAHDVKIVEDGTAKGSLKANLYPVTFKPDEGYGALRVNLGEYGGYWTVDDIESISFKFSMSKWTDAEWDAVEDAEKEAGAKKSGGLGGIYLNDYTSQNGDLKDKTNHIGWINTGAEDYESQTSVANRQAQIIDRNIPATTVLEYFQFVGRQWNTFYNLFIDSITIKFKSNDTTPPTVTVPTETQTLEAIAGGNVDMSQLKGITVTDDKENATWEVVSLTKDGTAVSVTGKKFTAPASGAFDGTYTLKLKGVDAAGNESEEKTVTFTLKELPQIKLSFGENGLTLDASMDTSEHKCSVSDGTMQGYMLPGSDAIGYGRMRINLTGLGGKYKVNDIRSISFHVKFANLTDEEWEAIPDAKKHAGGTSSSGIGQIFLNDNTSQNGTGPHHIAWINTGSSVENEWQTQDAPVATITGRGISGDEVLEYIQIAGASYQSFYKVYIDSVTITLNPAAA
ncbi:MAG: hypothetical protein HFK10_07685 [Clostridia bacterium]|nr:hypothetical protein [Clostridia bacterium]